MDYHKVILHNKPLTGDLLGKTQEGGYLCSGEKQQRTEWEAGFIRVSCGMEISRVGTGISSPELGRAQRLVSGRELGLFTLQAAVE